MKTICQCIHCGEEFGSTGFGDCALTCKNCRNAEGRKKIDEANKELGFGECKKCKNWTAYAKNFKKK